MKRWLAPFLLTLLAALPILLLHRDGADARPFREWSTHFDLLWGLEPSTLACLACIALFFWSLRELTDRPGLTLGGSAIFAASHWADLALLLPAFFGLAVLSFIVGVVRQPREVHRVGLAALALCGVGYDVASQGLLRGQAVLFPPGVVLVWVWMLVPLGLYARFERLRGRGPVPITPETPPATRTSEIPSGQKATSGWIELAVAATALTTFLADRGYLLPMLLLVVGLVMRGHGYRPAWGWQMGFMAFLAAKAGYLFWSGNAFPMAQPRPDAFGFFAVLFPSLALDRTIIGGALLKSLFGEVPNPVFLGGTTPFRFFAGLAAYAEARREWAFAGGGLALATLALLPGAMRGLTRFDLYGALLFRSLFVAALGAATLRAAATAWCPPSQPAPPRPRPAPGSLPRP